MSWLQSPSAVILEPPQNKVSHCFHCFPINLPLMMGPDAMILIFWMLDFKPAFSLSSFTFIKRLFSSSLLSAIKVVSSVYLKLLIFLPAILIPACNSPSPAFLMIYSANKLNKQGDSIQPWSKSFLIWNQSIVLCSVLTKLNFLTCIQISQEEGKVVWYCHLLKNFSPFVLIHIVKVFGPVNKAEVVVFLELLLFLWSNGCWQFDIWLLCLSKSNLNIWKFSVHILGQA